METSFTSAGQEANLPRTEEMPPQHPSAEEGTPHHAPDPVNHMGGGPIRSGDKDTDPRDLRRLLRLDGSLRG
jgi:hypothetical protein